MVQSSGPITLAISFQVLPASRICFSLCSSAADHGVFVLVVRFLLVLSSDNSDGIETLVADPASMEDDVGGGLKFKGRGSAAGLPEAGRFRKLEGADAGGGIVLKEVVVRDSTGREGGTGISTFLWGDEGPELMVLGRFAGGGVLCTISVTIDISFADASGAA